MKSKLFDYVERDNFVFNLSGMTKLVCFLIATNWATVGQSTTLWAMHGLPPVSQISTLPTR